MYFILPALRTSSVAYNIQENPEFLSTPDIDGAQVPYCQPFLKSQLCLDLHLMQDSASVKSTVNEMLLIVVKNFSELVYES